MILDTLHDHRSAFLFRTNPLGTRYDALVTDEGHIVDVNWDETWYAAAKILDTGWTAEIEIPFKALRLTGDKEQIWGIDFERIIRRKSEFVYWSNYRRGFDFKQVSYAGVLTGLADLDRGFTIRIKPFAKTAVTQFSPDRGANAGVARSRESRLILVRNDAQIPEGGAGAAQQGAVLIDHHDHLVWRMGLVEDGPHARLECVPALGRMRADDDADPHSRTSARASVPTMTWTSWRERRRRRLRRIAPSTRNPSRTVRRLLAP